MTRPRKLMLLFLVVPPLFLLFIAGGAWVVMQLWNWLLPSLFGLPQVTFWQALGLLALTRILFGGFGGGGHAHSRWRRRMGDRWETLRPEERERLKHRMRGWHGHDRSAGDPPVAPGVG